MSDEWFKTRRDLNAAEKDMIEAFRDEHRSINKKLLNSFVTGFLSSYRLHKSLLDVEEGERVRERVMSFFKELQDLDAWYISHDYRIMHGLSEGDAEFIGRSLGKFLAYIDYGIISHAEFSEEDYFVIEDRSIQYSKFIKKLDRKIKPKFIIKRLMQIARKHPDLDDKRKKLIIRIAAHFA